MAWSFISRTCALSLVALMAMSVRTLFTSHARCWSVGSLPYLACHLAVCESALQWGPAVPAGVPCWVITIRPGQQTLKANFKFERAFKFKGASSVEDVLDRWKGSGRAAPCCPPFRFEITYKGVTGSSTADRVPASPGPHREGRPCALAAFFSINKSAFQFVVTTSSGLKRRCPRATGRGRATYL
jgi:hypothetical protein